MGHLFSIFDPKRGHYRPFQPESSSTNVYIPGKPTFEQESLPASPTQQHHDFISNIFPTQSPPLPQTPPPQLPEGEDAESWTSPPDSLGVYRVYSTGRPSFVPDGFQTLVIPSDCVTFRSHEGPTVTDASSARHQQSNTPLVSTSNASDPHAIDYSRASINESVHLLLDWHWTGNSKTLGDTDRLVHNVLQNPNFRLEELKNFRGTARETEAMDELLEEKYSVNESWTESTIHIPVPSPKSSSTSESTAPKFPISGVYHRSIVDVVAGALGEPGAKNFHLFPFKEYWQSQTPGSRPVRTFGELYTSDAFLREHRAVQQQVRAEGRMIETVIIALMFWSDATHLASFGTASLWPIYMYIGNQSKYVRSKPSSMAAHHIAYVPKVRSSSLLLVH